MLLLGHVVALLTRMIVRNSSAVGSLSHRSGRQSTDVFISDKQDAFDSSPQSSHPPNHDDFPAACTARYSKLVMGEPLLPAEKLVRSSHIKHISFASEHGAFSEGDFRSTIRHKSTCWHPDSTLSMPISTLPSHICVG